MVGNLRAFHSMIHAVFTIPSPRFFAVATLELIH